MAFDFRKFIKGIRILPSSPTASSESGDLEVDSATGKLKYYNAVQVGVENSPVVTEAHQATLTNKTLTSPVLNTPTADTITGISGGAFTVQSASNQNLLLQSQGNGKVTLTGAGTGIVEITSELAFSKSTPTNTSGLLSAPSTVYALISADVKQIAAGTDSQVLILTNTNSSYVKIENEFIADGTGIRTGTASSIQLDPKASLILIYNATAPGYWYVVGGTGGSPIVLFTASNAAIVAGDAVYYDGTTVQRLDAGDDTKVEFIGVALDAGGGTMRVQVSGKVTTSSSGFTVGGPVFADPSNAGKYTSTVPSSAGQWIIPVGIAVSSTEIIINGAGSATAVKLTSESDPFVYAAVSRVTSSTTLVAGNSVVLVDASAGAVTITLPSPINGKIFTIKKVDSSANAVTIDPTGATTIDGLSSKTIASQYDSYSIVGDTTATPTYYII